jgi:hypothetical protein
MILRRDEILALIETANRYETAMRRKYYVHLQSAGPQEQTFEQHLDLFGNLVRSGELATEQELAELAERIGDRLPTELVEFYTTFGKMFIGSHYQGALEIFSAGELLRRLALPSGYQRLHSLGLVDGMRASYHYGAPQLEPGGWFDEEETALLNGAYTCFGWASAYQGEGFLYYYFDRAGRFGSVAWAFHSDGEDFYSDHLLPMQRASPATQTLSDLLLKTLRGWVAVQKALAELEAGDREQAEPPPRARRSASRRRVK